jgi:hypothetical protein
MPWPRRTRAEFEQFIEQHKRGPFYRLSYVREGVDPNSPSKIIIGCFHYLLVTGLAVVLADLVKTGSRWRTFAVILLAGLMGSLFITIGDPIWFHMPLDYTIGVAFYEVISWLLLAGVVSWILRLRHGGRVQPNPLPG